MASRWLKAREQINESVENFPIPEPQKRWLNALFDLGGDEVAATRLVWPKDSNPHRKVAGLRRKLSPYIVQASLDYHMRLSPQATGVLVGLMVGESKSKDDRVRLQAAQIILERGDNLLGIGVKQYDAADVAKEATEAVVASLGLAVKEIVAKLGEAQAWAMLQSTIDRRRLVQVWRESVGEIPVPKEINPPVEEPK